MNAVSWLVAILSGVVGGALGGLMHRASFELGYRAGKRDAERAQPELFYQDADDKVRPFIPQPQPVRRDDRPRKGT